MVQIFIRVVRIQGPEKEQEFPDGAKTVLVFVDKSLKPKRIPEEILKKLKGDGRKTEA